jgi:hypothetical protein
MAVMLACFSGTKVQIPAIDGWFFEQAAGEFIHSAPPTVMVFSWKMHSTSAREGDART